MGFRESFGLQAQGFRVRAGVQVVGALRLTISRPQKIHPAKKNALVRTQFFWSRLELGKKH